MRVTYQILIGAGKKACEDSTLIYDRDHQYLLHEGYDSMDISEPCIIAVADGVGGNPGGREASTFSLSKLMEKFQDLKTPFNPDEISEKVRQINDELIAYSAPLNEKSIMATTFTSVFFDNDRAFVVHAGNTRACAMNSAFIKQLTTDHTTYQYLRDLGNYEAAETCNKSEINSFLGGGDAGGLRRLEIREIERERYPKYLILTSDGIHEFVNIDYFEELMQDESLPLLDKTTCLIKNALQNYSSDDKTIVIVEL